MMGNRGQIAGEYLLLAGVLIIIVMMSIQFIAYENELNTAMGAARNGVTEGLGTSSAAIYSKDSYNDYSLSKSNLLHPYSVEIINITYNDLGRDGDRINYNLRKSLAICFNSTSSTNKLYNPVFSPHYVFTTANIKWV